MQNKTRNSWRNALRSLNHLGFVYKCERPLTRLIKLQKKVGVLTKSQANGPFADDWAKAFGDISKDVEEVDVANALSAGALSAKDEHELVRGFFHHCVE